MSIVVKITPNDKGNPVGKLADAELHFIDGELDGLKLIGFAIWERRGGNGRNVTFPARQYAVNGERRSFALLRPIVDTDRAGARARTRARGLRRVRGASQRSLRSGATTVSGRRHRGGVRTPFHGVRFGKIRYHPLATRGYHYGCTRQITAWTACATAGFAGCQHPR